MNETGKDRRMFFAITSLNKNRWHWVVRPSLEALQTVDESLQFVEEGYAESRAEAVRKASKLAGSSGGGSHERFLALQGAYQYALQLYY